MLWYYSHTPSHEQQQCGASGKTLRTVEYQAMLVQLQTKLSTSTSQHSSHSSTYWQNTWTICTYSRHGYLSSLRSMIIWRTQGDSFTYMVNEETLAFFSHCENKRCNRNVTHLHANPGQVAEDWASCVTAPSFHQPIYPDAQLPYIKLCDLHKCRSELGHQSKIYTHFKYSTRTTAATINWVGTAFQ